MEEHDSSYRKFFSFPQMVKDLLVGYVRESWISELNFDVMEPVETSFVSEHLRNREADVTWRIQWRKRWLYVYVLIEMQSTVDPMMAVRLMTYTGLLYQDIAKRKELTPSGHLPPVLPITLYNGNRPWSAATTLAELIEPAPESLRRYQPQFEYFLLDSNQAINPGKIPNLVTALISIENSPDTDTLACALEQLIDWIDDKPEHRKLARIFSVWIIRSLLPARFPGAKLPKLKNLLEAKDMLSERVVEWTKEWEQKGLKKGLDKGLKKGLEKGLEKGHEEGQETALRSVVSNMLIDKASLVSISRATGLPIHDIKEIVKELGTDHVFDDFT